MLTHRIYLTHPDRRCCFVHLMNAALDVLLFFVLLTLRIDCLKTDCSVKSWSFLWSDFVQSRREKLWFLQVVFLFLLFQEIFFVWIGPIRLWLFDIIVWTSCQSLGILVKFDFFNWPFRRLFFLLLGTFLFRIRWFVFLTLFQKIFITLPVGFNQRFGITDGLKYRSYVFLLVKDSNSSILHGLNGLHNFFLL